MRLVTTGTTEMKNILMKSLLLVMTVVGLAFAGLAATGAVTMSAHCYPAGSNCSGLGYYPGYGYGVFVDRVFMDSHGNRLPSRGQFTPVKGQDNGR